MFSTWTSWNVVSPDGRIKGCFLTFSILHDMDIDINDNRGQCYNTGANMSGIYSGLQSGIKQSNPLAKRVPCTAHNLKWVRGNSINCCLKMEVIFNFVQIHFNFSSKHTGKLLQGAYNQMTTSE